MKNKMRYVSSRNRLFRRLIPYFPTNRKIKDRLFCYIFGQDRVALLQLYNALNGTDYSDEQALEIVTLDNVVYMSMNNDVAFMLAGTLNLYEHQSTLCANLPLRLLIYIAAEFEGIAARADTDIYGRKLIRLPAPQCVVFYNGTEQAQDEQSLRLSDAFIDADGTKHKSCLELTVRMLNINYGHNKELMKCCGRLGEYSLFIAKIRNFQQMGLSTDEAVDCAVSFCIEHGIMADILSPFQAEVKKMLLTEYNEKRTMKLLQKEAREEGKAEGKAEDILQLLEDLGEIPMELKGKIMSEKDLNTLRAWHKAAAKAESILKFMEDIQK